LPTSSRRRWAQTFIVENISGGSGVIASQTVARRPADGYTLMLAYVATHGTNPAVRKVPVRPGEGLSRRSRWSWARPMCWWSGRMSRGGHEVLRRLAKSNKSSYGLSGLGSLTHLAMEQFRTAAGFDSVHAAYRGIGPAITDVLGGQTQMMMPGLAAALPQIKAGKLKPIAVTGTQRHPLLPDTPTFEELGFKGSTACSGTRSSGPRRCRRTS
jgi:tripartite-type tricarboxylate transporter receptor subunit TctC